jgi:predicted DNA-binding protein
MLVTGSTAQSSDLWYHDGTVERMAMTLRLTDEENDHLDALAAAEGRSKQEIMRLALAERWARLQKEQQLDEVLSRVLPRYQGLLERFGTA